ncbi:hypothetical protein IGI39_004521 [Enterococcus sp. AZ135]|uniref:restriction endonuclease subunit S n=1 Tax=unclassified Enterococcus TaxID=2608891 RepID=UPI003F21AA04
MNFKKTVIGKIPVDWDIKTIDELKSDKKNAISMGPFGSRIKKDNFVEKGVPIIRGNNLKKLFFHDADFVYVTQEKADELKSSKVEKNDIVITHRGTLGQVGYIPENSKYEEYIVSQSGMKLTVDSTLIEAKFLYYYLNTRYGQHELLMS